MPTLLGYAILGLLAREDFSGYDLAQALQLKVSAFWQARHSQIYPELARLAGEGLVEHRLIEQTDRPDKKLYAITDAGRAELKAWVDTPMDVPNRRDEFMLRAFSIWLAAPERAVALLRDHARQHTERREHYERVFAERFPGEPPAWDTPHFGSYITIHRGISYEREYAAWCAWAASMIERQTGGSATNE